MKKENVIYIGGKRYVAADTPEDFSQKPEPREMECLTPPPRKLSPWVPLRLLAGDGGLMVFGWIFACFGMMFVCLTLGELRFADLFPWRDAGTAELVSSEDIRFAVNEKDAYRHVFRQTAESGEIVEGVCYSFRNLSGKELPKKSSDAKEKLIMLAENVTVNLERGGFFGTYRIKDTTVGKLGVAFPLLAGLFSLIFPAIGLGIVGYSVYLGLRNQRLLKLGEIGRGEVLNSEMNYGGKHRRETSQTVTFRFTDGDGRAVKASASVPPHAKLNETAYQVLLYDPQKPLNVLPIVSLAESGIGPCVRTGEFRVTSVFTYPYTVIMTAINLFFLTILISQFGVFFRIWTWESWPWWWMLKMVMGWE